MINHSLLDCGVIDYYMIIQIFMNVIRRVKPKLKYFIYFCMLIKSGILQCTVTTSYLLIIILQLRK